MNLALLAKVRALAGSENAGEAAEARVMVEREGKTLADVPGLLTPKKAKAPNVHAAPGGRAAGRGGSLAGAGWW